MTNYEADNPSSLSQDAPAGHSWTWLTRRLPSAGIDRLGNWLQGELDSLESMHADQITARSRQRDLRHEFTSSRRSAE